MVKQKKQKYLLGVAAGCIVAAALLVITPFAWRTGASRRSISEENRVDFSTADQDGKFMYLSDIDYMPSSSAGWDVIRKDQVNNGTKISLKVDGVARTFNKGYWAHATSYLDFDLRDYNDDYDYLTSYVGINTTAAAAGSVRFCVFTSAAETIDPTVTAEWGEALTPEQGATSCTEVAQSGDNATFIKIPIRGVNYIRFFANANGSNASDHAVYGDLKLVKADYVEDNGVFADLADLDTDLKADDGLVEKVKNGNADAEIAVLRRNLVSSASKWALSQFVQQGSEEREMMNWLYNDVDALRMYTTGGAPTGSYEQSLAVLAQLYAAYKGDLEDRTALTNGAGVRGDLYKKMMIALSLTHSKQVRFWIRDQGEMAGNPESPNLSRPLDRYLVYKRMYLANKLQNLVFEQLEVEEMRYVMFTELGDDELEWLRDWLPTVRKGLYTYPPVPYISIGNHYWFDQNYDPNYIDPRSGKTWEDLYKLRGSNYTNGRDKSISGNYLIGFEAKAPHLWMINYYGGVCWQISNFGQNMTASYGVPSTTLGQPGHLAYANYELGTGIPAWALTNDVSGWSATSYTGYTNINTYHQVRQMNNWGALTGEYALLQNRYGYPGSYLTMAQAAINDFENYEKSQILVKTAKIYSDDLVWQEEVYNQAIEAQDFNFDAWYGLLENYINQGETKSAMDWYNLARKLEDSRMKSFAVPFHDLLQTIITKIPTDNENTVGYALSTEMILRRQLEWMVENNTNANIEGIFRQGAVTRTMANALLGRLNNEVAVFSFDGEDAGVLKLGAKYESSSAAFEYSLDGGTTWKGLEDGWVTEKKIQLTDDEIAQVNENDDIKVHIQGVPREGNIYTIDIKKATLPANLYANDKENRVVGVNTTMEWRTVETNGDGEKTYGEWISYAVESPLRIGDITIQVRVGATGVYVPSDASGEYHFTPDTDPDTRRYIPVSHLSVAAMSSQATGGGQYGNAIYAIDGNFNTRWHSAWNGSDQEQWIVIKFDHTVELAALGFVPAGGGNGRILQGEIYVTTAEEPDLSSFEAIRTNFMQIGKIANDCSGAGEVLCDGPWLDRDNATASNWNARTFEFRRTEMRDVLDDEGNPVVNEDGSHQQEEVVVHEAVTAKYVAIKATQTSNHGNFIAARMLNFYEDRTKNPTPTAGVAYSTIEPTNGSVIARLVNTTEDEIEVVDENGNVTEKGGFQHIFNENGEYTFRFRKVGDENQDNIGTAIAKVDWIMKEKPLPMKVEYICVDDNLDGDNQTADCSKENGKTNRSVSVKLTFQDNSLIRILNNGLQVEIPDDGDYDAVAPDPDEGEDDDETGDTISKDEDSKDPFTYLFMRNGRFTFEYEDAAGNKGEYTVQVDWIDKAAPKVEVQYSTTEPTEGEVVATLRSVPRPEAETENVLMALDGDEEIFLDGAYDENGLEYGEEFVMVNGEPEYYFTENGEYTFEYRDVAGNTGAVVAKVDWIQKKQEPVVPDKPDDPGDADDEKPDDAGNADTEKPSDTEWPSDLPGGTPGDNNGNNQNNQGSQNRPVNRPTSGNDNVVADNSGVDEKDRPTVGGDSVTVEAEGLPEGAKVERKRLALTNNLMAKFGTNSELYELSFVDAQGKMPELVKLPVASGKTLEGIYIVKEDGTTEKVEFERTMDGKVTIKNPTEGKYLFQYKAPDTGNNNTVNGDNEGESVAMKRWYENPWLWGGVAAAAVAIVGVMVVGGAISNRRR